MIMDNRLNKEKELRIENSNHPRREENKASSPKIRFRTKQI